MPAVRKSKARKKTARKARPKNPAVKKKATAQTSTDIAVKSKNAKSSLETRILEPLAEIEKILDQLRGRDWFRPSTWEWPELPSLFEGRAPSVDVVDRAKEIVVKAEVPGVEEEDLKVSVTDRTLTIKGESRREESTEEGDMHRREIHRGSFYRTLTLPADVDGRKAKATYKDGMLELRLPKARSAKKHRIKLS